MSLYDSINQDEEELKKLLVEEDGGDNPTAEVEEPSVEPEKEVVEEPSVEPEKEVIDETTDEPSVEPENEVIEEPQPVEPKTDSTAFAKARLENRELRERLEALEAKQNVPDKPIQEDVRPNKEDDYEGWLEYNNEQQMKELESLRAGQDELRKSNDEQAQARAQEENFKNALDEFSRAEVKFKSTVTDYDEAAIYMRAGLEDSIRKIYPDYSDDQVRDGATGQILKIASNAARDHKNPAEQLYYEAKTRFGYSKVENQESVDRKPDINSVDKNRRKSASSLSSGGQSAGRSDLTKAGLVNMSTQDFARLNLTAEKIREMEER